MHHPTDRITHTTAFVTPVVEHWLEREIAQWVHPMKDRSDDPSHHERTLYLWATSRSSLSSKTKSLGLDENRFSRYNICAEGALVGHWLKYEITQCVHEEDSIWWPTTPQTDNLPLRSIEQFLVPASAQRLV